PPGPEGTGCGAGGSATASATGRCPKWTGLKDPPNTPMRAASALLPDLPVADHDELDGGELAHPHRPARGQLGGRDAHPRAHAELAAVHEPGGGVHEHCGGVHLLSEAAGPAGSAPRER